MRVMAHTGLMDLSLIAYCVLITYEYRHWYGPIQATDDVELKILTAARVYRIECYGET